MGSGRLAVGGGAVLCRFGVSHWFVNGIHENGQGNGQQDEGVASGQGGKAEENGARSGAEQGEAGEVGQEGFHLFSPPVLPLYRRRSRLPHKTSPVLRLRYRRRLRTYLGCY